MLLFTVADGLGCRNNNNKNNCILIICMFLLELNIYNLLWHLRPQITFETHKAKTKQVSCQWWSRWRYFTLVKGRLACRLCPCHPVGVQCCRSCSHGWYMCAGSVGSMCIQAFKRLSVWTLICQNNRLPIPDSCVERITFRSDIFSPSLPIISCSSPSLHMTSYRQPKIK